MLIDAIWKREGKDSFWHSILGLFFCSFGLFSSVYWVPELNLTNLPLCSLTQERHNTYNLHKIMKLYLFIVLNLTKQCNHNCAKHLYDKCYATFIFDLLVWHYPMVKFMLYPIKFNLRLFNLASGCAKSYLILSLPIFAFHLSCLEHKPLTFLCLMSICKITA